MNQRIDLIYIDSGGGHRAAANSLAEVIASQERPWDLRLLNIQDLLDSIDFIRKITGIPFQDVYNIMLRHGWTLGTAQLIPLMHLVIRMFHKRQVRVLQQHWRSNRPDMVISLIPHYNRALKEAIESTWPGTPMATILTDIADYPPHFWIEPQDQYVICGSERAVIQARMLGLSEDRILRTSGMILNQKFYTPMNLDRDAERVTLGLRPGVPTGLVLFGGEGSGEIVKIAKALNHEESGVQLILLCGRHEKAIRELRSMPHKIPMFVEGFTREIPYYMALSDFFIGKPGPGSISEALAMQLPVIVKQNAWTLAHERYNAQWVREKQLGIVIGSYSGLAEAVKELLAPENFSEYRARVAAMRNFAVYEIPDLLERILSRTRSASSPVCRDDNPVDVFSR